jgi:hypothetical protein
MLFLNTFLHCGDKCFLEVFVCEIIKHLLNLGKNSQKFENQNFKFKLKKFSLICTQIFGIAGTYFAEFSTNSEKQLISA